MSEDFDTDISSTMDEPSSMEVFEPADVMDELYSEPEIAEEIYSEPEIDEVTAILDSGDDSSVEQAELPQEVEALQSEDLLYEVAELNQGMENLDKPYVEVFEEISNDDSLSSAEKMDMLNQLKEEYLNEMQPLEEAREDLQQLAYESQENEVAAILDSGDNNQTVEAEISQEYNESDQEDISAPFDSADENNSERIYDDFEAVTIADKPDFYDEGKFYEQGINEYGYLGTCGPTSQANAINQLLGTNELTENKVLTIAVDNGLCFTDEDYPNDCGGTTTAEFMELSGKVNEQIGDKVDVKLFDYDESLSVEQIAQKLDEGSTLNIAVDSYALWDEPRNYVNDMGEPTDDFPSDHWIAAIGAKRDETGSILGFDVIDSGGGVKYIEKEKFDRVCFGTEDHRVMDPTCIVFSKKELNLDNPGKLERLDRTPNVFERIFGKRGE